MTRKGWNIKPLGHHHQPPIWATLGEPIEPEATWGTHFWFAVYLLAAVTRLAESATWRTVQ